MRALVTGAGKRLGREMALYLAGRGYDVAIHYAASRKEAEAVVKEITAMGRRACALRADLLIESQVEKLIPMAQQGLGGPLTVLVNNASIFEYDSIRSATRKSWDRAMESNLRAPFVLTQAFAEQAPPAGVDAVGEPLASALIVNMIDQRVHKLTPEFMSYTLAKMGLWALTRTAAQGLAPQFGQPVNPAWEQDLAHHADKHHGKQKDKDDLEQHSLTIAREKRPVLNRLQDVIGHREAKARQEAALLAQGHQPQLVAVKLFQLGHQMRHAIGKTQIDRLSAHPDIGVEKVGLGQPRAAPGFDMGDEGVMDRALKRFQPVHVFGLLRQEGIGQAFRGARRDDPPFDAVAGHQVGEAEAGEDHSDGAEDGARVDKDIVACAGQPIAARGRDILDKGMHLDALLIRQSPDAGRDQAGLHRRAAGGVDDQGHGGGFCAEGFLDHRGDPGV